MTFEFVPDHRITIHLSFQTGKWQWKFEDKSVNVYYEEHIEKSSENVKNILMVPTISDVSTVEEFRTVAKDIVDRKGAVNFRATIVDWPGLGFSDRPALNYNADVMEDFLVKLINSPDSPVKSSGNRWLHYVMMVCTKNVHQKCAPKSL